jgi:potassium-dependent mechanosensitive channel
VSGCGGRLAGATPLPHCRSRCEVRLRFVTARSGKLRLLLGFIVAVHLLPLGAIAQENNDNASPAPAESPAAEAAPAATPLPLADAIGEADAEIERLDAVREEVAANRTSETIARDLQLLTGEITPRLEETRRLTAPGVPLETLRDMETRWQRFTVQLDAWAREITARATTIDEEIARLPQLRTTWTETLNVARESAAPPEVVQRITTVLKRLDSTEATLAKRRATILQLQSQIAEQTQQVQRATRSLRVAQTAAVERLWLRDSAPIWSPAVREAAGVALAQESQLSFRAQWQQLGSYAAREWSRFVYLVLIFAALAFVLRKVKQHAALQSLPNEQVASSDVPDESQVEDNRTLARANRVLRMPLAMAAVLAFLCCRPLFPEAPRLFWALLAAATLLPIVVVLRQLIERHLFPILNALVVFYLVAQVRSLVAAMPVLSRVILLLEMLGGAVFLLWFLRANRTPAGATPTLHKWTLHAVRAGLLLFIVVFVTNALGYVALANYLGNGALSAAFLALLLYAAAGIVSGLAFFALEISPLSGFRVVQRHRPLLRARAGRIIQVAAFISWILLALEAFGMRRPVLDRLSAIVNAEVQVRSLHISLGAVLAFVLTIWIALLLSRFIRFLLEEEVYERLHLARGSSYAVSTVLHYVILLGGFFTALAATGADMTKFAIFAGAFGVGLGFGLQNIFNNFFSGLILLFERPVQVGDVVEIGPATGVVQRIGIRASVIRLPNAAELIVPNGQLISEKVTNRTHATRQAQLTIRVGVAYNSDPEQVIALLKSTAAAHQLVAKTPAPDAFMKEFGSDALLFDLMFWTDSPPKAARVQSDVAVAVNAALRGAGIEIPFPQRTIRMAGENSGAK